MKIKFINNSIELIDFQLKNSTRVSQLSVEVREKITDWSSEVRNKVLWKGHTIVDLFTWEGLSTWWIGRLVHKNSYDSNQWLNRIMVICICKDLCGTKSIEIETDDRILIKTMNANKKKINVNIKAISQFDLFDHTIMNSLYKLKKIFFSLAREIQTIIFLLLLKKYKTVTKSSSNDIWFRTLYPINWTDNHEENDRLFGDVPRQDNSFGYVSKYLVFISKSKKDLKIGFFDLLNRTNKLAQNSKRQVYFPQKLITFKDIYSVYSSSFNEAIFFSKMSKKPSFRGLFYLDDLDLSDIFLNEWSTIYLGVQQQSKLQAIATSKFFNKLNDGQKIITYGEFFASNRATYYLTKKVKPETKFIAIQHALNTKNKMFTYFRRSEFDFDNNNSGKEFSPYPDYFLVHGEQYKKILLEFYEDRKVETIGPLKEIRPVIAAKNKLIDKITSEVKKTLLIAPSTGDDYKVIFFFLKDWKFLSEWRIILSPHPTLNVNLVKTYQEQKCKNLDIEYINSPTYQLFSVVDIVLVGSSTIGLEAALFNTRSVRVYNLGTIPQFDLDERIPTFYDIKMFQTWFESQNFKLKDDTKKYKSISKDYFYNNDGMAGNRLWQFISSIERKNNEIY